MATGAWSLVTGTRSATGHVSEVLRAMREVRTLVPYIRGPGQPAARAEVTRRIDDLTTGTQQKPWTALNLASTS